MKNSRSMVCLVLAWVALAANSRAQDPPLDGSWTADAEVDSPRLVTAEGLGAAQGIVVRDGKVYAYGDVRKPGPRVGIIREFSMDLTPTGRLVWLRKDGKPLLMHPTGLTWDARLGTFLGDTVERKAVIYRLDWAKAWDEGNLDHAVLDVIDDDVAVNGCRPTFVSVGVRTLMATADYGEIRPELRLYDPDKLLETRRTSAPGVVVHRILSGPWNQNLHWDASSHRLTCIQNVIEGRGWRLDVIDLDRAIADGRASGPHVRVKMATFAPHDELEGYWPLDQERSLLITSSGKDNIFVGKVRAIEPRLSPPDPR